MFDGFAADRTSAGGVVATVEAGAGDRREVSALQRRGGCVRSIRLWNALWPFVDSNVAKVRLKRRGDRPARAERRRPTLSPRRRRQDLLTSLTSIYVFAWRRF